MTKVIPKDEIVIWFNIHNMYYERIELFGDIFKTLNYVILDTHMGNEYQETKITVTEEDNNNHFDWCWKKVVEDFRKENITIQLEGDHKEYLKSFFTDTFYNQKNKEVRESIHIFLDDIFNVEKEFVKPDLDILTDFYKVIKNNVD